jgi:cytochrome c556
MKKLVLAALITAAGLSFMTAQVVAESHSDMTASEAVAERKALMGSMGSQTKGLVAMMRGAPMDWEAVKAAGDNTQHVAETMPTLFLEGSFVEPSTASPDILLDIEGITERFVKLGTDGKALSNAADNESVEEFQAAFGAYISNCKGCHQNYRI